MKSATLCRYTGGRSTFPVSILHKSTAGRYRPVRVADGPITAHCRFIKNASWGYIEQTMIKHNRTFVIDNMRTKTKCNRGIALGRLAKKKKKKKKKKIAIGCIL